MYRRNERIRRICRKLMALNLLPHRFIPRLFRNLKTQVRGALTQSLFDYMEKTWLNSTVWRPKSWSVFMQPIRTVKVVHCLYSVSVLSNKSTKYLIFWSYNFGYFIKRYSFKYGAGRVFKNWGRKGHPSGPTCDFPNWGRNGRAGMV